MSDVVCTHPYPLFTPHCGTDPVNTMRNAFHAAAETRLYGDIGGVPAFVEEAGNLGPSQSSDEVAGNYLRNMRWNCFAHDCRGLLWWCANDQTRLEHAPYDWAAVEQERKKMLDAFGTKLDLPMGLEVGMAHLVPEVAETILSQPGLDFVLGSCHNMDEKDGGRDFYMLTYDTLDQCYAALDNYFASMQKMAAAPYYDIVAHLFYPLRYMNGPYETPSLARYRDQIREIMRLAIESGRGIEINTWKGRTLSDWIPMLKDNKEQGRENITEGSDAHPPEP